MKAYIKFILAVMLFSNVTIAQTQQEYPYGYADPINEYKNKEGLHWDIFYGEGVFNHVIETDIENIKKTHQMVRKVFLDNPSANHEEFKDQVWGVLKEMKEIKSTRDLVKFSAKIGLDAFIDLFTSLETGEVNKARQAKYDVIIDAMVVEVFPGYEVNTDHYNFEEKFLYESLREKINALPDIQKYYLRAMVIAGPTFSFDTFYTAEMRFDKYMQSPWMFQRNLKNRFQKSKYRYRD